MAPLRIARPAALDGAAPHERSMSMALCARAAALTTSRCPGMGLVALSIVVLAAAPALAALLVRRPLLAAALDSFVLVSVGGIVALHVIPESARIAGPIAL